MCLWAGNKVTSREVLQYWRYQYSVPGLQIPALADTILPGAEIQVCPDQPIDVSHRDRGRIYPGHVARDVFARDGDLAVPRGSYAELIVRQTGPGQYTLDLESVTVNGSGYAMDTTGLQYNMPRHTLDNGAGLVGAMSSNGPTRLSERPISLSSGARSIPLHIAVSGREAGHPGLAPSPPLFPLAAPQIGVVFTEPIRSNR